MIIDEKVILDGKENSSVLLNSPKTTKAAWSANCDTILIHSKVIFQRGNKATEMVIDESWSLLDDEKILAIKQYSNSMWGRENDSDGIQTGINNKTRIKNEKTRS